MTHDPDQNPPQQTEAPWTTRRLLGWITEYVGSKGIESPRLVAEMLLAHVIGCERMRLYMEVDRPASPLELMALRELVARAAKHEPVQYLVGHAWFFGREFQIDKRVLIPRPCTETLVEHVLQHRRAAPGHANPIIADIGTGSGCIAISLALHIAHAKVIATDESPAALDLARVNAQRHHVADQIEFRLGRDLQPFTGGSPRAEIDVICSNPPYICDAEWAEVESNVRDFEPMAALRGGADGLDVIRVLIAEAGRLLRPGGQLVVEIAHSQREAVLELVAKADLLSNPIVLKDHEDFWRVLIADRPQP
ncbi:MAG: peptide chain release factor N(5)-glutamine methyltransferase [Phycisphaerales bacterium]